MPKKIGHLIRHLGDYPTPASALAALLDVTNGQRMFTAKITDIKHVTKSGFNFGTVLFFLELMVTVVVWVNLNFKMRTLCFL